VWNAQDNHNQKVSSGIYFVKMQAGAFFTYKEDDVDEIKC